jgi:hypothetical protein
MFRRTVLLTAVLAMASTSALAQGAKVSSAQGAVFANRAGQMTPVKAGSVLQSGDRIVATSGAARITYSDGCNVAVTARSMVTVADASPCAGGSSGLVRVQNGESGYGEGGAYVWDAATGMWIVAGIGTAIIVGSEIMSEDDDAPTTP